MITRCNNGHWYDSGIHKSCPHCRQAGEKLGIWVDDIEEDDHTVSIAEAGVLQGEELNALIEKSFGKTAPQEGGNGQEQPDEDKTIAFGFFGMTQRQPVTGWLVCMTGSERGQDYRLHVGKNFIGRSPNLNGRSLKATESLKEGDEIMIGATRLIFVPFNREDRKWEEE